MSKVEKRIIDLLAEVENINKQDITRVGLNNVKIMPVEAPDYNNQSNVDIDYWNLHNVHSNVYEFKTNEPNSSTKLYIFKSDTHNNIDYYTVINIAFNKDLKKVVSNYSISTSENLITNYNIYIDNMYNESNEYVLNDDEHIINIISEELSKNFNIIKAACVNEDSLYNVMHELLTVISKKDIPDEYIEPD